MKPSVGRIVAYRTLAGVDIPAIIVSVTTDPFGHPLTPDHVELHPFWNGRQVDYINDGGVPGPAEKPGHWRWPEPVE